MFTGIIKNLGKIEEVVTKKDGAYITVVSSVATSLIEGASLAVNGVCLTVLSNTKHAAVFRLMNETLKCTNIGQLRAGDVVNLEQPLTASQPIDGHFVLGHVDGIATVTSIKIVKMDKIFTLRPPKSLLRYLIPKGSVALDGVSLTVVDVADATFTVSMMPYTLSHTLFGQVNESYEVNLEVDVLGKYVVRLHEQNTKK